MSYTLLLWIRLCNVSILETIFPKTEIYIFTRKRCIVNKYGGRRL